jgi:hypothetical protein
MHQHRIIEDTIYFWFASNNTSGSGSDGATPVYDVRLAGAAAGAAPVLSGSGTLLTHANYPDGCHEVAVAATTGNGFVAGNTYGVFCTLLVDAQNPTGFIGSFSLEPIIADLREMGGVVQSATDLKDFADAGYDPGTNKVQGVVLVDTTTTNSDMRGTDNAATAANLTTHDGKLDTAQLDLDTITGADGATLATAQGNYAPAKAGDLMGLVNDAITSDKYDESTAFSVKSDDSGSTQIARVGADGDTLETLSDQIDGVQTDTTAIKANTDNLPSGVKKNTALSNFEFFMVDSTDHITGKTGLTITAERSIDGGAFGATTNSVLEISAGVYKINLSAGDLNGDVITLKFAAVGADARLITFTTNS